jgi:hypothetical protein
VLQLIKNLTTSAKFKGIVSVVAAVVMYFTPDDIDKVIETLLGGFGITTLVIGDKKND